MIEEKQDCSICCEKLKESFLAPCKHEFCVSCILAWSNTLNALKAPTNCPMCRRNIDHQVILDLRNASPNKILSLEDFVRLQGVSLRSRGVLLNMKDDNEWLANLQAMLTISKREGPRFSNLKETISLKIRNQNLLFDTPALRCIYHKNNIGDLDVSCLTASSVYNDLSFFEKLDNFFKKYFNDPGLIYKNILKESNQASTTYLEFPLPPPALDEYGSSSGPLILSNSYHRMSVHELLDRNRYQCQIVFSITFMKLLRPSSIYPKIKVICIKYDKIQQEPDFPLS